MVLTKKLAVLLKIYPYIWSNDIGIRFRWISAIFLIFLAIGLNIGVPLVLRQSINAISNHSVVYIAELLLVAYGALWTLAKMIEQLRLLAMNRVVERGIRLLTLDIFDNLTKLSLRYHSDRKTGAIISAVDRAQYACPGLIWGVTFFIIPTLLEIVFAAIVLIYLYGMVYGLILAVILITHLTQQLLIPVTP